MTTSNFSHCSSPAAPSGSSPTAVSREDLLRVLEAARWAPSNHNRQPWRFIVLEERQPDRPTGRDGRHRALAEAEVPAPVASGYAGEFAHYATFFAGAPVLIVVLHKQPVSCLHALLKDVDQPELVSGEPLSVAMAVQNLLLAAHALGLGTCVLTAPLIVQEAVLGALNLPAGYDVTCLVALGYPGETPAAAPKEKYRTNRGIQE